MIKIITHDGKQLFINDEKIIFSSEIREKNNERSVIYTFEITGFIWVDKNYSWLQKKIFKFLFWVAEK